MWTPLIDKPNVSFAIAYTADAILLKYFVEEYSMRITQNLNNAPVHVDSCVEFFICFNNENSYYNLEFNSIGICDTGFGKSKAERVSIPPEHIAKIKRESTILSRTDNGKTFINWELCLVIPSQVFIFHTITFFEGLKCKANFYKCGDDLPSPHFLSWQKIISEMPNFHLPRFFGNLHFK